MSEEKEFRVRTPRVGEMVQWFSNGEERRGPVAAVVTKRNETVPGLVHLSLLIDEEAGVRPIIGWVRHMDDPHLVINKEQKAEVGAWREIPKK